MKSNKNNKKDKDVVLKLTLSVLLIVFGLILLIDQLDVQNNPFVSFVDDLFTPWYTIIILFIACCLLAHAIIRKAPIFYVLSMFFAGLFLTISISAKVDKSYLGAIIFILPMFVGLGFILADRICKWSPKILRFGVVLIVASAVVLVSVIMNAWKYVIPIVIVLIGVSYMIFELISLKQKNVEKPDDHYVTYTPKDEQTSKINADTIVAEDISDDGKDIEQSSCTSADIEENKN